MTDSQLLKDFCKWLSFQKRVHFENEGVYVHTDGVYVYDEVSHKYLPAHLLYLADVEDGVW